jgi:uncharacterized protein (DUF924 family)
MRRAANITKFNGVWKPVSDRSAAVIKYWFGDDLDEPKGNFGLWYGGTPEIDNHIRETFGADVDAAIAGKYDSWADAGPLDALALVVLLDQFALNLWREGPEGYDTSKSAVPRAYTAIGRGYDMQLAEQLRQFFYLPLMHSELLIDQDKCVALFIEAGTPSEYAVIHRDIVAKYGRFPGRNKNHGRTSTEEEVKYFADGGEF